MVGGTYDELQKITDARGHDITLEFGGSTSPKRGRYDQVTRITRPVSTDTAKTVVWQYDYQATAAGTCDATVTRPGTGLTDAVVARTLETDPEGHTTNYCYNADGQVIQTIDGNGRKTTQTYNAQANVERFTGLAGTANPSLTTYSFQSASPTNTTGTTTPVGSATQTTTTKYCGTATGDTGTACTGTYPLDKYLPRVHTDENGITQGFTYSGTGDLTDVSTTSGSDGAHFTYDGAGNILTSTDGLSHATSFTWTSNFLTAVTPPSPLAALAFGPDPINRVKWAKDGNGVTTCVTYDGEDRVTGVEWRTGVSSGNCASGTLVKWMNFSYDENGNVLSRSDDTGHSTTYAYDYANRRTAESFPSSRNNGYSYDRASNLKTLSDNDGAVNYTYDNGNRVKTVVSPKPTSGTSTITYDYADPAAASDPSTTTTTFPGGMKQVSTTDGAGNVVSVKVLNSGGTVLKKRDYTYTSGTAVGSKVLTMADEAGNSTAYGYGAMDRLTSATTTGPNAGTWGYTYDAAGNRTQRVRTVGSTTTTTNYAYNNANQVCQSVTGASAGTCGTPPSGATTYSYDGAGQRTTSPSAAYDPLQRLTTLGGTALGYMSPGNGELVSYGTTSFQNTMLGLARIIPGSGTATDVIRTPDGAPVAQRLGATNKQQLFTDALGSVIATADDGSTGTIAKSYAYDPDGNATSTGSGTDSVVRFAGGYPVGGLYHFGARFYDPSTASWTQQDPLNQLGSLKEANRYVYVGGNPINGVDPTGLSVWGRLGGCLAGMLVATAGAGEPNKAKIASGCIVGATEGERITEDLPPGVAPKNSDPLHCKELHTCVAYEDSIA